MHQLIISEPGNTPQAYRIDDAHGVVTIGRGSDNGIIISSESVSTTHCSLERVKGGYFLRDRNSTNGIILGDKRQETINLKDGMEVLIGEVSLKLQLTAQPETGRLKKSRRPLVLISGICLALLVAGYFVIGPSVGVSSQSKESKHSAESSNAVHLDPEIMKSFLSEHCTDCHGPDKQKGSTRLDTLSLNISDSDAALHWRDVLDALNLGDMPPEDEKQPSKDELQSVIKHLTLALETSKKRLSEAGGDIALRRINRREYRHTIHQLLGMRIGDRINESVLPEDSITEGYDTVGQDQQFSSHHFEDYFEVGKTVATAALYWVDKEKTDLKSHTYPAELQHKQMRKRVKNWSRHIEAEKAGGPKVGRRTVNMYHSAVNYLSKPYNDKGVFILESSHNGWLDSFRFMVDPRGTYKFNVKAGLVDDPPPIRQFLAVTMGERPIGYLKVSGSLDSPQETQTLEYQPRLRSTAVSARFRLRENKGSTEIKDYLKKIGVSEHKAAIWVDAITVEGPFYGEASALETIYTETIATVGASAEKAQQDQQAKQFLKEFMHKAFRGKEGSTEYQDQVIKIYSLERDQGKEVKESLVTPLAMILSSPSFLYLIEEAPESKEDTINDVEFANRITHFLWSRPASGQFLAAAKAGQLEDPTLLKRYIDSMLRHKNSWALSEGFFNQWVDIKRFDAVGIDETTHVKFNKGIRESAKLEVQHFFHTLLKENLSLSQLIDSDFVVINELLGLHYGLEVPNTEDEFSKVTLPVDSPRGGLLGTVAFLSMGSNGERSSPIIRGALIQDKFLNREPPPPPPNVPELENASDKPLAVKEAIDLHRSKAQCASCHSSFDPLGFGLENFDLLGLWRDQETVGHIADKAETGKGGNPAKSTLIPVRAEGVFPNKEPFHNLEEFRTGLLAHEHLLARSISEGLLSYGLGRHIEFADQQALDEICKAAADNDHQIGDLIYSIISHPLFKKGDQPADRPTAKN